MHLNCSSSELVESTQGSPAASTGRRLLSVSSSVAASEARELSHSLPCSSPELLRSELLPLSCFVCVLPFVAVHRLTPPAPTPPPDKRQVSFCFRKTCNKKQLDCPCRDSPFDFYVHQPHMRPPNRSKSSPFRVASGTLHQKRMHSAPSPQPQETPQLDPVLSL